MTKVVTRAMTTKMVKVRWLRILAWRPILRTISSTRPLQDMRAPMVKLSLQTILHERAARVPPTILPTKATVIIPITYAHVMPLSRRPMLVLRPDRAK